MVLTLHLDAVAPQSSQRRPRASYARGAQKRRDPQRTSGPVRYVDEPYPTRSCTNQSGASDRSRKLGMASSQKLMIAQRGDKFVRLKEAYVKGNNVLPFPSPPPPTADVGTMPRMRLTVSDQIPPRRRRHHQPSERIPKEPARELQRRTRWPRPAKRGPRPRRSWRWR